MDLLKSIIKKKEHQEQHGDHEHAHDHEKPKEEPKAKSVSPKFKKHKQHGKSPNKIEKPDPEDLYRIQIMKGVEERMKKVTAEREL